MKPCSLPVGASKGKLTFTRDGRIELANSSCSLCLVCERLVACRGGQQRSTEAAEFEAYI